MSGEINVVLFMHMSIDGFAAGLNGELDWISYDKELEKHAEEVVATAGAALYGRVTYHMMANYWPTVLTDPSASRHDLAHAQWVENVPKFVFSKTLNKADWNNTTLIKKNIKEEIQKLKQIPNEHGIEEGKKLMIFGSPGLAKTFTNLDLIDEYQFTVNQVILGNGVPVFDNRKGRVGLKLLKEKTLNSGVVTLYYKRKND